MVAGPGETKVSNAQAHSNPLVRVRRTETADGTDVQHMQLEANAALRVDEASSTETYIGKAKIGTGTGQALWQIFKIDTSSGTAITWADSDDKYDNVWDDRASLTYG